MLYNVDCATKLILILGGVVFVAFAAFERKIQKTSGNAQLEEKRKDVHIWEYIEVHIAKKIKRIEPDTEAVARHRITRNQRRGHNKHLGANVSPPSNGPPPSRRPVGGPFGPVF